MSNGLSAAAAACAAVRVLEDSSVTNAGYGSNLNGSGFVECDASVMEGSRGHFGAVGTIRGVRNPIDVAYEVMKCQSDNSCSGLVPPMLLCGTGAYEFARQRDIEVSCDEHLSLSEHHVTDKTRKKYIEHTKTLDAWRAKHAERVSTSKRLLQEEIPGPSTKKPREDYQQDTVGAVCIDSEGSIASCVSSGGIWLKKPGRVGEASMYGCGCYADDYPICANSVPDVQEDGKYEGIRVGCSVSGTGEYIQRVFLASQCAKAMAMSDQAAQSVHDTITSELLDCRFLSHTQEKPVGVLAVKCMFEGIEVIWSHSTESFGIGYQFGSSKPPVTKISRLEKPSTSNTDIANGPYKTRLKTSSSFMRYK
eukprot:CFRG6065T1